MTKLYPPRLAAVAATALLHCITLAGQDWYQEDPATAPPARRFHAVGYDLARTTTVLFGGVDERAGTVFGDTWEYDGADWRLRAQDGPPARQRLAACVHRARGTLVVFGGLDASGQLLADTWEWNGTAWSPLVTAHAPSPRADAAMAFDETRGRVVLFGGRAADPRVPFGDTWEFDGVDWQQRAPSIAPAARFGHAMTFDPNSGVTLLFGGFASGASGTNSATFAYDGTTWRAVVTATTPPPPVFPALTFHRAHGVAVLTGATGSASQPLRTFAFDGVDWQAGPVAPTQLTGRQGHTTAYDEVREAVVLFGGASIGFGGARPLADTWELSVPAAFVPFGTGCKTSAGPLELAAAEGSRPELGRDLSLSVAMVPPASTPVLLLGASGQSWAGIPLPLDLTPLGMPGCALFTSIDMVLSMIPLGQTAHAILPIPLNRRLLGRQIFAQVLVLGAQIATSNAGAVRFGN